MKEVLKLWLAPLLAFAIAYGVFWSYSYISGLRQTVTVLIEQRDALLSGLQERCEVQLQGMGYRVIPMEGPQEGEPEKE